mmetsp:Transcript_45188/g.98050  ORF Transcript_45188/g.98050 Transcript_45188/m.98050 type:complete len:206 (+) Transcript_45188:391-1008(+)
MGDTRGLHVQLVVAQNAGRPEGLPEPPLPEGVRGPLLVPCHLESARQTQLQALIHRVHLALRGDPLLAAGDVKAVLLDALGVAEDTTGLFGVTLDVLIDGEQMGLHVIFVIEEHQEQHGGHHIPLHSLLQILIGILLLCERPRAPQQWQVVHRHQDKMGTPINEREEGEEQDRVAEGGDIVEIHNYAHTEVPGPYMLKQDSTTRQ